MPKFGEYKWLLDIAFFLYPDEDTARRGQRSGGTGFLIAIPSDRFPEHFHHIYGVSNWHVIRKAPVVRINSKSGPPAVFNLRTQDWYFAPPPNGYDLALTPLALSPIEHKAEALAPSFVLTDSDIAQHDIAAGEDVFMLGRFVDYDGVEVNEPSLRFGNISIMRAEIEQPNGCRRTSIVADVHSRTGFSGSPVFVYRNSGSIFSKPNTIVGGGHLLKLLGVHYGQFPERWDIGDTNDPAYLRMGKYVKGLSGMSCVIPAQAILELLNLPALATMRNEQEKLLGPHHSET